MEPRIIKTKAQHREALAEVERLTMGDPRLGTPAGDRLELLAKLVENYEKQRFPFARPDTLSAIRFRMEVCLNCSNAICEVLPTPHEAKLILPLFFFA